MTNYQSIHISDNPVEEIKERCSTNRVFSLIKDTIKKYGESCFYEVDGFVFSWVPEDNKFSLGVRKRKNGQMVMQYVVLHNRIDVEWIIEHIQWIEEIRDNGSLSI